MKEKSKTSDPTIDHPGMPPLKGKRKARQESGNRLSDIIENTQAGYFHIDREGRFQNVNAAWLRMHGYASAEEVIGRHFSLTQFDSDLELATQVVANLLAGHPVTTGEFTRRCKDGAVGYHTYSANPITENGKITGLEGFLIDTTEQRKLIGELRHERHQLQTYLDTVETIILALDTFGNITAVNKKGCRLLGYREDELLGRSWFTNCLPQPDGMEKMYPFFLKLMAGEMEAVQYFDNPVATRKGELRYIAWHNALLRNEQEQIIGALCTGNDVTERRQAQEALYEKEIFLDRLLETIPVPVFHKDTEGRYQGCNRAFETFYGKSRDQLIGKTVFEVMPPELAKIYHDSDVRLLEKRGIQIYETQLSDAQGMLHDVVFHKATLLDLKNTVTGLVGVVIDITDRRVSQQALEKSNLLLSRAQKIAHLGSWELDIPTGQLMWSDETYRIFGLNPQEFLPTYEAFLEAIHPEDRQTVHRSYAGSINNGKDSYEIEHRVIQKNTGEIRHVHEKCEHVRDETGKIVQSRGMLLDITDRKHTEMALIESEEKFFKVFEKAPVLILISSIEDGTCLDINEEFTKVSGFTREESIGKTSVELGWINPANRDTLLTDIQRHGSIKDIELELETKDKKKITCLYRGEAINIGGRPRLLSIGLDITDRKQADENLRKERDLLYSINETSPVGITFVDREGKIVFANPQAERILGLSRGEITRQMYNAPIWRITDENGQPFPEADLPFPRVMATGKPVQNVRHAVTWPDGRRVLLSVNASPIRDAEGRVNGMVAALEDITESRLSQQALRESEEKYRALIEGSPDVVMRFDKEGRHLFVSENVKDIAGVPAAQFIGKTHRELGFPDPLCSFLEKSIRRVFQSEAPFETEFTFDAPRGAIVFDWRLIPELDTEGNIQSILSISRNITAHRHAEQEYRTLFTEMLDGFALHEIICDDQSRPVNYRFLAINPAFERMTGLKAENVIGHTVREVLPGTEQHWIDAYGKVALTGDSIVFENYHAQLNKLFEVKAFRPAPNQFACIFADITERKRAKQELQISEEKFRKAFNTSPDAINLNRLEDGLYSSINPGFTRIMEYTEADIIGKSSIEFSIWDNIEDRERLVAGLKKDGEVINLEAAFRTKSGDIRYGLMSASVIELNGVPYILSITRDITDRKRGEEELKSSYKKLEALWHISSLVDADSKTIADHILASITRMTNSKYGFYGFVSEDESVMTIHTWCGDAMADCAMADKPQHFPVCDAGVWGEAIRHREPFVLNHYAAPHAAKKGLPGGHVDLTNLMVIPYFSQGRITALAAVANTPGEYGPGDVKQVTAFLNGVQSIVEHRRAEEEKKNLQIQLIQAQKMESIGRLAGGVAHDFNNILGVILGNAELAMEQVGRSSPVHDKLTEIRKAAERSAELTRQLLAFARKQTTAPRILDLNQSVEDMLKMLQRLIGENIELVWLAGRDLWPVKMDPGQIDQLMVNLCINGRDAISGRGKISIETKNTVVNETASTGWADYPQGDFVLLTVSDNGSGIDKETQAKIFEPFFTTKDVGQGSGLGLATVYGIVKQNNGHIHVDSEPGWGTAFKIYLPRHAGTAGGTQVVPAPAPAARGRETILLTEDEPALLKMTATMLERLGYTVLPAGNPREAVRLAREQAGEIHLLMTDVVMPEMNGRELADKLRAAYPGLRCLYMSGYTADIIATHGVLYEGVHFIQKPFLKKDLAIKIREVLEEK